MESAPSSPRVAVLGPVLVEDRSGALTEPSGPRSKRFVVALALANGPLSVSSLVADLWDDAPPRQERAALQTLVSRLRTASADGLVDSTPGGYALASAAETDLGLARRRAAASRGLLAGGDAAAAVREATAALLLWRGEPGAELGDAPLADDLARAAQTLRDELLLVRSRAHLAAGDPDAALDDLRILVETHPLDESLQRERMTALAAAGRRSEALLVFADLKEALLDRLGTRPGQELVALNARLLAEDDAPDPAPPARVRIGLRSAPNALLGREYDVDALEDLIATSRLVTILGPGGLGKTRLAQEIGRRAIHLPAVVFVELASVRSSQDIELAFASTLGIREAHSARPGDPGALVDLHSRILGQLAERETLLIVDNCEHIVDDAAAYIADVLDSTSNVRVLATSRSPLAIGAERVYPLDSLASADDGPAVELFVERARAARPGVVLPRETVARLCDRLDGLPLAIELAAARTRSLSVDEIERRLGNRFALLTGGDRTAPERHRTLFAVIDWSWNLLASSEQALLRRLSAFADGFSSEAAEAVAGPSAPSVLDDLDALVTQSLVTVTEDAATGLLRYRMLETVREFGDRELEAAGEAEAVRDGMDAWAVSFARSAMRSMHGRALVATFGRVTAEQDNLVGVLRSAIDGGRPETVAAVFALLSYYWSLRSAHSEVLGFGPSVLGVLADWEAEGDARDDAAACFTIIGGTFLYVDLRTSARAIARLRRLRRVGPFADPRLRAMTNLILVAGKPEPGMRMLVEYAASGDPELAVLGNLLLAQLNENAGELQEGLVRASRAYALGQEVGDAWSTASAAQALAQLHSQLAHPEEALLWAQRAHDGLAPLQAAGDLRQLDWLIAINSVTVGDTVRGRALLEQYLSVEVDRTGFDYVDYYGIGYGGMAEIALAEGDLAEGIRRYAEAVGVFVDDGVAQRETLTNPWLTMLGAAQLVVRLRAHAASPDEIAPGSVPWSETDELARRLRVRVLVYTRLNTWYIDKPVLGSGLLAYAAWMLDPHTAHDRGDAWVRIGLELVGIATRLNSRQDMASMQRARLAKPVMAAWGADRLAAAIDAAAALSLDEASSRGLALLTTAKPTR
ncbi:AAA family ATPase [Leifsonia sp. ZF2019]|uniref:AfsR/SARP family transcriptional regulator n=1 Tax=Leifsonia sp. ZF2019 TaxID=2781978 RepID=UPI001CBBB0A3|nr:BTAD domain-containing putative transcriptional regulator [Leifsonia sp. ZF2019]UAJ78431.1 AAA family ATPase [Leifsonia sp. ZF2019]